MPSLSEKSQKALDSFVRKLDKQKFTHTLPSQLHRKKKYKYLEKLREEAKKEVANLLTNCPEALSLTNIPFEYGPFNTEKSQGSLLAIAAKKSYPICEALLNAGCDVNLQNAEEDTALHLLAKRNGDHDDDVIQLLKERNADVNILNKKNETAFSVIRTPSQKILLALCPHVFVKADLIKIAQMHDGLFQLLLTNQMFKEKILTNKTHLFQLAKNYENTSLLQYFFKNAETWVPLEINEEPLQKMRLTITMASKQLDENDMYFVKANAKTFYEIINKFKRLMIEHKEKWPQEQVINLIKDLLEYVACYFSAIMQKIQKVKIKNKAAYILAKDGNHGKQFNKLWISTIDPIFQFLAQQVKSNINTPLISKTTFDIAAYTSIEKTLIRLTRKLLTIRKQFFPNDDFNHHKIQILFLKKIIHIPFFGKLILRNLYYNFPEFLADIIYLPNSQSIFLFKELTQVIAEIVAEKESAKLKIINSAIMNTKINSALKFQLILMRDIKRKEYIGSLSKALNQSQFNENSIIFPIDIYAYILNFAKDMDPDIFTRFLRVSSKTNKVITDLDNTLNENDWHDLQHMHFGQYFENLKNLFKGVTPPPPDTEGVEIIAANHLTKIKNSFFDLLFYYLRMHNIDIQTAYNAATPSSWEKLISKFYDLWEYKNSISNQMHGKMNEEISSLNKLDVFNVKTEEPVEIHKENKSEIETVEIDAVIESATQAFNNTHIEAPNKIKIEPEKEEKEVSLLGKRKREEFTLLTFLQKRTCVETPIESLTTNEIEEKNHSISSHFRFWKKVSSPLDIIQEKLKKTLP